MYCTYIMYSCTVVYIFVGQVLIAYLNSPVLMTPLNPKCIQKIVICSHVSYHVLPHNLSKYMMCCLLASMSNFSNFEQIVNKSLKMHIILCQLKIL